ncbi:hypothetical protein HDU93_003163, partial [Gonapodya sp. JEL0774]
MRHVPLRVHRFAGDLELLAKGAVDLDEAEKKVIQEEKLARARKRREAKRLEEARKRAEESKMGGTGSKNSSHESSLRPSDIVTRQSPVHVSKSVPAKAGDTHPLPPLPSHRSTVPTHVAGAHPPANVRISKIEPDLPPLPTHDSRPIVSVHSSDHADVGTQQSFSKAKSPSGVQAIAEQEPVTLGDHESATAKLAASDPAKISTKRLASERPPAVQTHASAAAPIVVASP